MSDKEMPSYYSIIPATVRYDHNLKANEKLMYGEITALASKNGYCWAENRYFAELYDVHKITISKWLKNLEDNGYIRTELKYVYGTKQVSKRLIYINDTPINQIAKGYESNDYGPVSQNAKEELSNTSNNNTRDIKKERQSSTDDLSVSKRFEKIWKEYPKKQGKKPAFSSYKTALKNGTTDKEIIEGLERYKQHLQQNTWKQPAQGSTWFKQNRWEDEYEEYGKNQSDNNALTGITEDDLFGG